jgi:hypothetical protein
MVRKVSVRLCTVALVAASLAMIPMTASSASTSKVSCTKEFSPAPKITTGTIKVTSKLSGCVNLAPTATNASTVNTKTLSGTSKTTWAGGKGTTLQTVKYVIQKTLGKCPKGNLRIFVTSTVTGGTGAALKAIPKGSLGKTSICSDTKKGSTLEAGTKATF